MVSASEPSASDPVKPVRIAVLENRGAIMPTIKDVLGGPLNSELEFLSCYQDARVAKVKPQVYFLSAQLIPYYESIRWGVQDCKSVVFGEPFTVRSVLWWKKRGAIGLMDLRDSVDDWRICLATILSGKVAATPHAQEALNQADPEIGLQTLTRREMDVSQFLVLGNSAEQAAKKFGTTVGTIKNQRKSSYRKLGIVRATQLPWALGNGIPHPSSVAEFDSNGHRPHSNGAPLSPHGD